MEVWIVVELRDSFRPVIVNVFDTHDKANHHRQELEREMRDGVFEIQRWEVS